MLAWFLYCITRHMQHRELRDLSQESVEMPAAAAIGAEKPQRLRIRIPSGIHCSSCTDFKVLQHNELDSWTCGLCIEKTA